MAKPGDQSHALIGQFAQYPTLSEVPRGNLLEVSCMMNYM